MLSRTHYSGLYERISSDVWYLKVFERKRKYGIVTQNGVQPQPVMYDMHQNLRASFMKACKLEALRCVSSSVDMCHCSRYTIVLFLSFVRTCYAD